MKNGKNAIAIALCIIFAASIVGTYIYERRHQAEMMEVYARVIPEQEKLRQQREREKEEYEARREEARLNYINAVEEYLPGMAFCGDSLMSDTGGGGMDFRSTVNSLVRSNICNSPTVYINITNTPNVDDKYSKYIPIIFMGAETDLSDAAAYKDLASRYIGANERYLVVGPTTGNREGMSFLEYTLSSEFGDKFLNIREYMSTEGLPSLELEITQEDQAAIDEGRIPPSLLKSDGLHLNDNGTRLLAYLTYDRMEQLGYFNEVAAAKEVFDDVEGINE